MFRTWSPARATPLAVPIAWGVFLAFTSIAQVAPELIDYQGKLTDAQGTPLDGIYALTFSIYASHSTPTALWTETHSTVTVSDGLFHVLLGSELLMPEDLFHNPNRYLGIQVGSDPEMLPRSRLASVPYAMVATSANDGDWQIISGNAIRETGRVGIGTRNPSAVLEVDDTIATHILKSRDSNGLSLATDDALRLKIDQDGDVGIGEIANPAYPLHVYEHHQDLAVKIESNSGDTDLLLDAANGRPTVEFRENGQYRGSVGYSFEDDYMFIYEDGNLVFQDGKLGLGTKTPVETLDVEGSVKIGANGRSFTEIREFTGTTSGTNFGSTDVPLPAGWTQANTRVLNVEVRSPSSNDYIGAGFSNHTWDYLLYYSISANSPAVITLTYNGDSGISWKNLPYRILAMKLE